MKFALVALSVLWLVSACAVPDKQKEGSGFFDSQHEDPTIFDKPRWRV